jgi:hypothetical protein
VCELTHGALCGIFDKDVTAEAGRATLASLLLLPHGWQAAVQPSPRAWLGSYVTAVLRVRCVTYLLVFGRLQRFVL